MLLDVNKLKVAIIQSIITQFNNYNIFFTVVSGLEKFPRMVGRDIDVVIFNDVEFALELVKKEFHKNEFYAIHPPPIWGKRIIGIKKINGKWQYLEFHSLKNISWGFIDFNDFFNSEDKQIESKLWLPFVRKVLLPVLANNERKLLYNIQNEEKIFEFIQAGKQILSKKLNSKTVVQFFYYLEITQLEKLIGLKNLKRDLILHYIFSHPGNAIKNLVGWIKKKALVFTSPCGPLILLNCNNNAFLIHLVKQINNIDLPMFFHLPVHKINKDYCVQRNLYRYMSKGMSFFNILDNIIKDLVEVLFKTKLMKSRQQLVIYYQANFLQEKKNSLIALLILKLMNVFLIFLPNPDAVINIILQEEQVKINECIKNSYCCNLQFNSEVISSINNPELTILESQLNDEIVNIFKMVNSKEN